MQRAPGAMYSTTVADSGCNPNAGALYSTTGAAGAGSMYSTTGAGAACVTGAGEKNSPTFAGAASTVGAGVLVNWRRSNVRHKGCDVLDLWLRSSVGRETCHVHVAGLVGVDGLLLGMCDDVVLCGLRPRTMVGSAPCVKLARRHHCACHSPTLRESGDLWRHAASRPSLARSRATNKHLPTRVLSFVSTITTNS